MLYSVTDNNKQTAVNQFPKVVKSRSTANQGNAFVRVEVSLEILKHCPRRLQPLGEGNASNV